MPIYLTITAMKAPSTFLAPAVLLLALALPATTEAAPLRYRQADHGARPMADQGLTLDQAVARMERQYKARAVRAEQERRNGRVVYRIRLLSDDGRVLDVTVDAATGAVE
jgi:uncharacterized membrane protein YkoI